MARIQVVVRVCLVVAALASSGCGREALNYNQKLVKYDKDMAAPVCVAKGADSIALKIREVATDNDVPIVENPPLARALYASVDIDETIPTEHFKAVAQVIGFVMRLRQRSSWKG